LYAYDTYKIIKNLFVLVLADLMGPAEMAPADIKFQFFHWQLVFYAAVSLYLSLSLKGN
jgi:hypothetical protein